MAHKITYIHIDDFIDFKPMQPVIGEMFQTENPDEAVLMLSNAAIEGEVIFRNFMHQYLRDNLQSDDILFFADVDEVPLHETIDFVREHSHILQYPLYVLGECIVLYIINLLF